MTTTHAEPQTIITLDASYDGGWSPFVITATPDQIIEYVSRVNGEYQQGKRGAGEYVNLTERVPDDRAYSGMLQLDDMEPTFAFGPRTPGELRLLDYLYPTCEHGMSADLCMGPGHFMDREQEIAAFGY